MVAAQSRMLGLSGQWSDSGQQPLCSPARWLGEGFCLISALLLAAGSGRRGARSPAEPGLTKPPVWDGRSLLPGSGVCVGVCGAGSTAGKQ